jgi:hypothetical protein
MCKATLTSYLEAGGSIPHWVINMKLPETLSVMEDIRLCFARDAEVDKDRREAFADVVRNRPQVYTDVELASIESTIKKVGNAKEKDMTPMDSPVPNLIMKHILQCVHPQTNPTLPNH